MPRIKAATVVEHRRAQRAALLLAAQQLLEEGGAAAVVFAALAERAGLSRPGVYEYFPTRSALLLALLEAEVPRWLELLEAPASPLRTPLALVERFARVALQQGAQGRLELVFELLSDPDPAVHAQAHALHRQILGPLLGALQQLELREPLLCLRLFLSVLRTGIERLRLGEPRSATTEACVAFGLAALQAPGLRSTKGRGRRPGATAG